MRRGQTRKLTCAWEELSRLGFEILESLGVERLPVAIKGGERAIDEIDAPGFTRPWRIVGGNDLGCHRFNFDGLFGRKEFKLGGRSRLSHLVSMFLSLEDCRPA